MKTTRQGVRDLSGPSLAMPPPMKEEAQPAIVAGFEDIHDLIYDDTPEIRNEIKEHYPTAKLRGCFDEIHEERLEVEVRTTRFGWFKFLLGAELTGLSLTFQLALKCAPEGGFKDVEAAMDAVHPGWRERSKERRDG